MTDKRFVCYERKGVEYILDNPNPHLDFIELLGDALTGKEIVKLLNELHEENQHLKQQLEDCRDANTRCCNEYSFFHKEMMKAENENTRIKNIIKSSYETERTKLGQSVLKQLMEAIE